MTNLLEHHSLANFEMVITPNKELESRIQVVMVSQGVKNISNEASAGFLKRFILIN